MLKLNLVDKSFAVREGGTVEAIRDVSLTVADGEFVAIVGPSGCGKTTLLRIMAGLEQPTDGTVTADESPIVKPGRERGMVFQSFSLFPWLTVAENIAFGLRIERKSEEEVKETVRRYLAVTGLTQFRDAYPHALSGGMRQRVAIARALANQPTYMFLDEPFGALDVQTRSQMQEFLTQLWEEDRRTMVMVTHDVDEALFVADRVVILSTKPGTVKEIIEVNLPRPRRGEIRFSEEFEQLKKYINYTIRAESIKATIDTLAPNADPKTLRIGMHAWPGVAPFYLAKERGLFARRKIAVELFGSESKEDRLAAWKEGRVDVVNSTIDAAVLIAEEVPETRILMPSDLSAGSDALIAAADISSIADLKGKRIAIEHGLVGDFFLAYILQNNGLSLRDVTVVDTKVSDVGGEIIADRVSAGLLWEPWLSKARELSQAKILASSADCPFIYSVLLVKDSVWRARRAVLEELRAVWRETLALYRVNPSEAIRLMAPYFGVSELELAEQLDGLRFVDATVDLVPALRVVQETLLREGLLKRELAPEEILLK